MFPTQKILSFFIFLFLNFLIQTQAMAGVQTSLILEPKELNVTEWWYYDGDVDGYGDATNKIVLSRREYLANPQNYSRYVKNNLDCDDDDSSKHRFAKFYIDFDQDGYGTGDVVKMCVQWTSKYDLNVSEEPIKLIGYSLVEGDCDDHNSSIHENILYYVDADGDGLGDVTQVKECVVDTTGLTTVPGDCDDSIDYVQGPGTLLYEDLDQDGYGSATEVVVKSDCTLSSGSFLQTSDVTGDCDDTQSSVNPAATEEINADSDNNCDNIIQTLHTVKIETNDTVYKAVMTVTPDHATHFLVLTDSGMQHIKYENSITQSTTLTTTGSFSENALVSDQNGFLHVAYYDASETALKYATNKSGAWVIETVSNINDEGTKAQIAVDQNGFVHIAYLEEARSLLKYATNNSGNWIVSQPSAQKVRDVRMILDENDAVHLVIYSGSEIYYLTNQSGSWLQPYSYTISRDPKAFSLHLTSQNVILLSIIAYHSGGAVMENKRYSIDSDGISLFYDYNTFFVSYDTGLSYDLNSQDQNQFFYVDQQDQVRFVDQEKSNNQYRTTVIDVDPYTPRLGLASSDITTDDQDVVHIAYVAKYKIYTNISYNSYAKGYQPLYSTLSACGDGVKQGLEFCDDANLVDGDGCTHLCEGEHQGEDQTDSDSDQSNNNEPASQKPTVEVPTSEDPVVDNELNLDEASNSSSGGGCSLNVQNTSNSALPVFMVFMGFLVMMVRQRQRVLVHK